MTQQEAQAIVDAEIAKAKKSYAEDGGKPDYESAFVLGWLKVSMVRILAEVASDKSC